MMSRNCKKRILKGLRDMNFHNNPITIINIIIHINIYIYICICIDNIIIDINNEIHMIINIKNNIICFTIFNIVKT